MRGPHVILFSLALAMGALGCDNDKKNTEAPAGDGAAQSAEGGTPSGEEESIQIKGSDSEVNVVQRIAEEYMKEHDGVKIAVTGGGSGTGIAALIEGTADIANSSRPLKAKEKLLASRNKVEPVATVFATDALSVIVNKDNPVEALTLEQLGAIFSGESKSWKDVGGEGEVTAYGRQSSSGTYVFFRDAVVKGDYGESVREMNGNAQIVEAIAADAGGVGYVAVGYLKSDNDRIKAVPIVPEGGGDPVSPLDAEAVKQGKYPIARRLYQYTNGKPDGVLREFLLFETSARGQELATEMGFYPIVEAWKKENAHLGAAK